MFRNEVWHTPEYGCGLLQIVFSGGKEEAGQVAGRNLED